MIEAVYCQQSNTEVGIRDAIGRASPGGESSRGIGPNEILAAHLVASGSESLHQEK
jgi:hypothetical protein